MHSCSPHPAAASHAQGQASRIETLQDNVEERDVRLQEREREATGQAERLASLQTSLSESKEQVATLTVIREQQQSELVREP